MGLFDLTCAKSVNLINGDKNSEYKNEILHIGYKSDICLYFELPQPVYIGNIKEASLILYKIPYKFIDYSARQRSRYRACAMTDFFSIYNDWYDHPGTAVGFSVDYEDDACLCYTEIDITPIVKAWIDGKVENKGILLRAAPDSRHLVYASEKFKTSEMYPTLRLIYEGVIRPLDKAPCTVQVEH